MRSSILIIPIACLLLLACGCRHAAPHRFTEDFRFIPTGLGDTLPCHGQDGARPALRYDALYVMEWHDTDGKRYVEWYRFWPTGRVLKSDLREAIVDDYPDRATGADWRYTTVGRYGVAGDTLYMEFYDRAGDRFRFCTYTARLDPDGGFTLLSQQWQRGRPGEEPPKDLHLAYRRKIVGDMARQPDW